jgi:hypothetical protein
MDRGYTFSAELLQMMLSEERQKFVSALGQGASWGELNRIKRNINQINSLLDSTKDANDRNRSQGRFNDPHSR